MQTQFYLRQHGLLALCEQFFLRAVRHKGFPNLVLLKYNQLLSPMGERVVQECRGLILDEANDWSVVSHPFDKFFNVGEGFAADVDWTTARVLEKLDGSLMSLYFYDGAWQVASSGTPDASGHLGTRDVSMAQGFWEVWHQLGLQLPPDSFAGWWFGFEFMTPWNQVVVRHETPRIVCIGARQSDGQEWWPHDLAFGWPTVASFPLASIDEVLFAAQQISPMNGEGFVVCDADFHRVKIKSPQYVALHHLRDQVSIPKMLDLVRSGEGDEFLSYFPDFRAQFEDVRSRFEAVAAQADADFLELRSIENPRDFAFAAQKKSVPPALFALRNGKVKTAREFFAGANTAPLIAWLGLREEVKEEEN